ncbi:hypothetical protein VN97_g11692, partial [Penicillium thymicola]
CLLPDWERGHCLHCLPAERSSYYINPSGSLSASFSSSPHLCFSRLMHSFIQRLGS